MTPEITYEEWAAELERTTASDRPPCPYCDAPHPESSGNRWICTICGASWVKHPRGKVTVTGREDICCPDCGVNNPISWGNRWQCRSIECGRKWQKKTTALQNVGR